MSTETEREALPPQPEQGPSSGETGSGAEASSRQNEEAREAREEAARRQRKLRLMQSIDEQPDFASLKAQMVELQRITRSERAHSRALTALIDDNPALLGKLLRLVNAAFYATAGGGEITSMHRAVSLMGFRSVGMLAGSLLLFERLPKGADGDRLRREFARAQLAATLAHDLCHSRKHADHIYIAALFQRLGELLAGLHIAADVQVLDDLLEAQDLPRGSAQWHRQREVLARQTWGVSFEELGLEIAGQWGWPPRVLVTMRSHECTDPETPLQDDEYARVLNTACNTLADLLMSQPDEGTPEERELARKLLIERWSADLLVPLGLDAESLVAQIEGSLVNWRELLKALGVPADAFRSDAGQAPPPKKNKLDPKSAAYRQALAENLSDAVDQLARLNKRGAPPEQIMEVALAQMMKALDLQRAILCLLDPSTQQLTARMSQGHKAVVLARHFQIPVAPPGDLFGLLCSKSADVLISDTADPLIDQRLPPWYKEKVGAGCFVLLSITVNDRVLGMMYGDQHEAESMHLNDRALTLLKQLRNQVLEALRRPAPAPAP